MEARTYLFVPGNRPERFAKALGSGADAVVLGLEDAVAPAAKDGARAAIARRAGEIAASDERSRIVVRINEAGSPAFESDLRLMREAKLHVAMLAKAECPVVLQARRTLQRAGA